MTCKRSKQCDHADLCRFAQSDDYNLLGGSCFTPKDPQTNEKWIKSANTEQLAEAIYYLTWFHTELDERLDKNVKNGRYNDDENIKIVMEWLKQPHTTKE